MQTGLSHQGEKSYCLQRDCLTTCVWTGDDQKIEIPAKFNVNGNDPMLFNQRMAGFAKTYPSFRIKNRFCGILFHGQSCPGKDKVQFPHDSQIGQNFFKMLCCLVGKAGQDSLDLRLFFKLQLPQFIVHFNHGRGFYKQCGSGGGLVMDHAGHLTFILCFDRDTVTAVSHGDHGILQISAESGIDQTVQAAVYLFIGQLHLAANILKRRGCVITDLFFRKDAAVDLGRQKCQGL